MRGLIGSTANMTGLRYFYEVALSGSFRGASDRIHVASSAVSRQVQILEEEFGVPLFERGRGRGGVHLTDAGQILLNEVRVAIHAVETAKVKIEALRGMRIGHVKLGVNESLTRQYIPRFLSEFSKSHPGVTFTVLMEGSLRLIDLLLSEEVEIILAYNLPARFGMQTILELDVEIFAMMHASHALARRATVSLEDLGQFDILLPHESLSLRHYLDEMFGRAKVKPRAILSTNSYSILQNSVAQDLGIAIITSHLTEDLKANPNIRFVPLVFPVSRPWTLSCCIREGHELSVSGVEVVRRIREALFNGLDAPSTSKIGNANR